MGSGSSVMAPNGGAAPPTVSCRGGDNFELKINMLKETPLGKVLAEPDLAYFSTFFTMETLAPHSHIPMCAGELLVVGEGEVQVYVIQAGLDTKTGEQSFVLCTKRKGDLIWVPTVTRLAKQKSSHSIDDSADLDGKKGEEAASRSTGDEAKHKELYNVMDTTYIDSLYGATLLKVQLDRKRYVQLRDGTIPDENNAHLDLTAIRRVIDCNMEDYLRKVPLFRHIPPGKLAVLGEMCNYEFVKAGKRVCSEGEAGNEIFIVLDGHLAVFTSNGGELLPLATLGPGDYFGELAALIRIKRIATVVSDEDTLLASIKRHDFRSFMTIMPDVRAAMDKVVKEHLLYKYSKVGNRFFPPQSVLSRPSSPTSPFSSSTSSPSSSTSPSSPSSSSSSKTPHSYDLCEVEDVDAERIIIYENDSANNIYYLSEGQVRLHRKDKVDDGVVLTAGAILGARAVTLDVPEHFSVVTDQVCVFLRFGPDAIAQHFENNPHVKATLEVLFKQRATPLATLLECPEGYKAFSTHLEEEFTLEHLKFYDDVLRLYSVLDEGDENKVEATKDKLEYIHHTYLALSASSPLNIPDSMRQRFLASYAQETKTNVKSLRAVIHALDDIKREVLALLERDNYSRFKNTEAFGELIKHLKVLVPTEPC